MKTKKDYIKSIADNGLLWSYKTDGVEDLPESVVIEQVLRMGDVEDIIMLFRLFDEESINHLKPKYNVTLKDIENHFVNKIKEVNNTL